MSFNIECYKKISLVVLIIPPLSLKTQSYTQNSRTVSKTNQIYTASATNESGVFVTNDWILTLTNSTVKTTSNDNSSFFGLNAGILANALSKEALDGCRLKASGSEANGAECTWDRGLTIPGCIGNKRNLYYDWRFFQLAINDGPSLSCYKL